MLKGRKREWEEGAEYKEPSNYHMMVTCSYPNMPYRDNFPTASDASLTLSLSLPPSLFLSDPLLSSTCFSSLSSTLKWSWMSIVVCGC